jgi:hypothetical protein
MTALELQILIVGFVCGFVLALHAALVCEYLRRRREEKRGTAAAVVKAALLDEIGRYKGLLEHTLQVHRLQSALLDLSEREIKALRGAG